jgi:hypothetical protein
MEVVEMATAEAPSELVVAESGTVVIEPSAEGARSALDTYQQIQKVFDEKMPDAIMEIQGKKFRKKAYWRGIAAAFQVESRLISEERVEIDGDWGYLATYRATTGDGRQCDGDGACMASEKHGAMCTVHNVRAHAHTRAKNRAIADLVGFGEVSADELPSDAFGNESERAINDRPRPQAEKPAKRSSGTLANEKQIKMLSAKGYARAKALTGDDNNHEMCGSIVKAAMRSLGFESKEDITKAAVDPMVAAIESAILDREDESHAMIPEGDL